MRFYVFTPGSPGYISAEVAVRELSTEPHDEAHAWARDTWAAERGQLVISRSEALMMPRYREALDAWERRNDDVLQATEAGEVLRSRKEDAAAQAKLGCSMAAASIAADDDDAIRDVVMAHVHDERCGGRDFLDPRRTRRLRSVS
jgi:hypothetical protein